MITPPQLPLATYRLQFQVDSKYHSRFPGSAWRGALGHQLRQLTCLTGASECTGCREILRCSYSYIFDTPIPSDASKMRRYTQAPHPFVLREEQTAASYTLLYLTLIGWANAQLPVIVLALTRAAFSKPGINGRQMKLLSIDQQNDKNKWHRIDHPGGTLVPLPPKIPATSELKNGPVIIKLLSPLRVKRNGSHVSPGDFQFADLFGSVLRRVSMLIAFHTEYSFETDFRALMAEARRVSMETALEWIELPRHSSRQRADMILGGVIGSLKLESAVLEPFWPILWLGQYTHAGTAATMGLGHYRLEQTASLRDATSDMEIDDTDRISGS